MRRVVADLLLGGLAVLLGIAAFGADAGPLAWLFGAVMVALGAALVYGLVSARARR